MTPTWNAYNCHGDLLMSFNTRDLAETYRDTRATIGVVVTVRRVSLHRRAA